MFLAAIFIVAVVSIYLVTNRYNKIAYLLSLYFISISGLLIITAVYISKVLHYSYISELDNKIFLFLSRVNMSVFTLARAYNYFMALYMLIPVILKKILTQASTFKCILLILPIIYYIIINDPLITWEIFRISNAAGSLSKVLTHATPYISKSNTVLIYIYSILPIYVILRKYLETKLEFKKKYYGLLVLCISLISVTFIAEFNIFLRNINGEAIGFTKVPANQINYSQSIVIPTIIFTVVFIIVFATIYVKPLYRLSFTHKNKIISDNQRLTKNYKIMMHTYKNAFLSIDKISSILEKSIQKNDTAAIEESIKMLKMISSERTTTINQTLNFLKNPYIKQEKVDIVECLNKSITEAYIDDKISVTIKKQTENTTIHGDKVYLQDAFVNVLNNASQALIYNEIQNPQICISISQCEDYIIISIKDNGLGVTKSEHKKIFIPFYSSKSPTKNSGIGLNCVQKIIKLHNGHIQIKSEPGEYFDFRIILPQIITKESGGMLLWIKYDGLYVTMRNIYAFHTKWSLLTTTNLNLREI